MRDTSRLNATVRKQHGVFSRKQALEFGFDRSAIFRAIDNGAWVRLDQSVYALASAPSTWERQLSAALLGHPEAFVGHRSAAHLLGFRDMAKTRPTIVVPEGANRRSPLARVIESDQFDLISTTVIRGFRVSTAPETFLSLGADVQVGLLEPIFDDAVLSGKLDLPAFLPYLRSGSRAPNPGD